MVFRFQALPIVEMSTASTSYKEGEFGMTQYDTPFHFWVRLGMAMASSSRVGVTQKTSWLQGHSACCNTDLSTHWKQGSDGVTWQQQQLCPVSHNMRWTASHKCQSQHAYTRRFHPLSSVMDALNPTPNPQYRNCWPSESKNGTEWSMNTGFSEILVRPSFSAF